MTILPFASPENISEVYRRIPVNLLPVYFGFHTEELRKLLEIKVKNQMRFYKPPIKILLNLTDFIACNLEINLYQCCNPEYSSDMFKRAELFLTNLLVHNDFRDCYFDDFKSILQLFGTDVVLMSVWLSELTENCVFVCPTIPSKLNSALPDDFQLFNTGSTPGTCDLQCLTAAVGGIQFKFRYAGKIPVSRFFATTTEDETEKAYKAYLAGLLCSVWNGENFKFFPLCYNQRS